MKIKRELNDADPWLGDLVRLPDGSVGKVVGCGTGTCHVEEGAAGINTYPEADCIVVKPCLEIEMRYGRNHCWRKPGDE